MIPFNKPPITGDEQKYIEEVLAGGRLSGDGLFTRKCEEWFEKNLPCKKALLTTSCTHSLEIAAMLIGIKHGDEVIMPSYTFVSTANAFVLRGARIVFVDTRKDTQNIDEKLIEQAITTKTKAIVVVHYAGIPCEMDTILQVAQTNKLYVVEDAAQGMFSTYDSSALGTIGHIGTYSFHETKNYTSGGEGGLILINDEKLIQRAEIIRAKGTNKSQFFQGIVDKYSWVDIGSSYLPNGLSSAFLWAQLVNAKKINDKRLAVYNTYVEELSSLAQSMSFSIPAVPENCKGNGHMFYLKLNSFEQKEEFISYMKKRNIQTSSHYAPLHSSTAGKKYGRFSLVDHNTTVCSQTLVRLPIFYNIEKDEVTHIIDSVKQFFK